MAEKVKRSKTNYTSIYFNESTKKYDVKYNFKEYDVKTGKNKYRAKWAYNLNTIAEAKKQILPELFFLLQRHLFIFFIITYSC